MINCNSFSESYLIYHKYDSPLSPQIRPSSATPENIRDGMPQPAIARKNGWHVRYRGDATEEHANKTSMRPPATAVPHPSNRYHGVPEARYRGVHGGVFNVSCKCHSHSCGLGLRPRMLFRGQNGLGAFVVRGTSGNSSEFLLDGKGPNQPAYVLFPDPKPTTSF